MLFESVLLEAKDAYDKPQDNNNNKDKTNSEDKKILNNYLTHKIEEQEFIETLMNILDEME